MDQKWPAALGAVPGAGKLGGKAIGRAGKAIAEALPMDEASRMARAKEMGFFTDAPVRDYAGAQAADHEAYAAWCRALLARGVYAPPSPYEAWFVSAAHCFDEGEEALSRMSEALPGAARAAAAAGEGS